MAEPDHAPGGRAFATLAVLRAASVTVPLIVLAGFASGWLSNSGYGNAWFDALEKPAFMPPGWAFPVAWTILYVAMAVAFAIVLAAPESAMRGRAVRLFLLQLALNLVWSPLFFAKHQVAAALALILVLIVVAALAARAMGAVRPAAGRLMLPYLAWLLFAAALNGAILRLN